MRQSTRTTGASSIDRQAGRALHRTGVRQNIAPSTNRQIGKQANGHHSLTRPTTTDRPPSPRRNHFSTHPHLQKVAPVDPLLPPRAARRAPGEEELRLFVVVWRVLLPGG